MLWIAFGQKQETDFKSEAQKKLTPQPFWKRVASGRFIGEFDLRLKRLRTVILKADDLFKQIRKILGEINAIEDIDAKAGILDLAKQLGNRFRIMEDPGGKNKADEIIVETRNISIKGSPNGSQKLKNQYGELTVLYLTLHEKIIAPKKATLELAGLPLSGKTL